jgi:hypothetical protein
MEALDWPLRVRLGRGTLQRPGGGKPDREGNEEHRGDVLKQELALDQVA